MSLAKPTREKPVQIMIIKDKDTLQNIEQLYRNKNAYEINPFAKYNTYNEVALAIKDKNGDWNSPMAFIMSLHNTSNGIANMCDAANLYLKKHKDEKPCDILSISANIEGEYILLRTLIRYYKDIPDMEEFYNSLNEIAVKEEHYEPIKGNLVIPDEVLAVTYTEEEKSEHKNKIEKQNKALEKATKECPFLNSISTYTRQELYNPEDDIPLIYDLKSKDMMTQITTSYDNFINVFNTIMTNYVSGTEYNSYIGVLKGLGNKDLFISSIKNYINREFVSMGKLPLEDVPVLMRKIERALFQFYIIQDLIEDPDITDINITEYDSIRVRVKGKSYLSNITFIDPADYRRFIHSVLIKNKINLNRAVRTFTDQHDDEYILRFSFMAPYVMSSKTASLHIRKVPRKKLLGKDLIEAGMFDEKIMNYLLDCGKYSRGVVFAGPPGSGKTVALNWFLEEAYEQSADILCIQENDELFSYKKGLKFMHPVLDPDKNEERQTLEDLGEKALVAGSNVFIIGEAKGAEICSAITLSNSGCRTAMTIHSPSSTETIDKMADLAMRGYAESYEQAKRSIKSFETIVYLENFKIQEISRIIGYDDEKKDMIYQYIYKREN